MQFADVSVTCGRANKERATGDDILADGFEGSQAR